MNPHPLLVGKLTASVFLGNSFAKNFLIFLELSFHMTQKFYLLEYTPRAPKENGVSKVRLVKNARQKHKETDKYTWTVQALRLSEQPPASHKLAFYSIQFCSQTTSLGSQKVSHFLAKALRTINKHISMLQIHEEQRLGYFTWLLEGTLNIQHPDNFLFYFYPNSLQDLNNLILYFQCTFLCFQSTILEEWWVEGKLGRHWWRDVDPSDGICVEALYSLKSNQELLYNFTFTKL